VPAIFEYTSADGSTLVDAGTVPLDNYMRFWLLNHFTKDELFKLTQRVVDFEDGRGMRLVDPKIDGEFIVGRIDGVTLDTAKALVDRAIDAENQGVFGKLLGSKFGKIADVGSLRWRQWDNKFDKAPKNEVYSSWHYQYGLFGEYLGGSELGISHQDDTSCAFDYIKGETVPQHCVVRLTSGGMDVSNDPYPGNSSGLIPRADNALVYLGYLDGQQTLGNFDNLLNWKITDTCQALCDPTDTICTTASVDVYKEIDTRCVNVADGFIGYNFQSYPMAVLSGWPTGWFHSSTDSEIKWHHVGGTFRLLWFPEVLHQTGIGYDDDYALGFDNNQSNDSATCYADSASLDTVASTACNLEKKINLNTKTTFSVRTVSTPGQTVTVKFKYKAFKTSASTGSTIKLRVKLFVREQAYNNGTTVIPSNNQLVYTWQDAASLDTSGSSNKPDVNNLCDDQPSDKGWCDAIATFQLDANAHLHPNNEYTGYKIRIESNRHFQGNITIDNVSIEEDTFVVPLDNPNFTEGHRQTAGGDHAVSFLNRLNGTAFWGSVSHHGSRGHAFDGHPLETLVYFMRGLPLGDAVWFAEHSNSGLLIGDPLYSPLSIRLNYINSPIPDHAYISDSISLVGDVINGKFNLADTHYSVDYCSGTDFFQCDTNRTWISVEAITNKPVLGTGKNESLGVLDASELTAGQYVLRLSVTATNTVKGKTQTFYDYVPITLVSEDSDYDGDGFDHSTELDQGTNPWVNEDNDQDYLPDAWEVFYNLDNTLANTYDDHDSDGVINIIEYLRGFNPNNDQETPFLKTHVVDSVLGDDSDGTSPFATYAAATIAAQAGDTISLTSGIYTNINSLDGTIHLTGPTDRSAIIASGGFIYGLNETNYGGRVNNLTFQNDNGIIWWYGKDLKFNNIDFNNKGVFLMDVTAASISNSFFHGGGNGLYISGVSSAVLNNVTITDNEIGINIETGGTILGNNTLIHSNTSSAVVGANAVDFTYSLVDDNSFSDINSGLNNGNFNADPYFSDAESSDYHLLPNSPAVDKGDLLSEYSNEPGANGNRINIGAYGNTREAAARNKGGDINQDGVLSIADIIIMQRFILELSTSSTEQLRRGDIYPVGSPDNQLTISDLVLLQNRVLLEGVQ